MRLTIAPVPDGAMAVLAALHAACFREGWPAASFAALLATPGAFALLASRQVSSSSPVPVGFIACRAAAAECEVLSLGVAAQARGQRIGQRLLEAAEAAARLRGARMMFLEVAADNLSARALYARLPYIEVGKRSRYYTREGLNSVDALVLRHDLGDDETPSCDPPGLSPHDRGF